MSSSSILSSGGWSHCAVGEFDNAILCSHVGGQELLECIHAITGHAVEWITHGAPVGIQFVLDSAVAVRVIAHTVQGLVNPIIVIIGNHDKHLARHSFGCSLRNKHVLRPAASTEVELCECFTAHRSTGIQIAESPIKRNCNGRLVRVPRYGIHSLFQCDYESVKFNEHALLVPEEPWVAPLVKLGRQEYPACSHPLGALVVDCDVVGEWLVLQVRESYEDCATGLEVHSTGQVHVGLLPECVKRVRLASFR